MSKLDAKGVQFRLRTIAHHPGSKDFDFAANLHPATTLPNRRCLYLSIYIYIYTLHWMTREVVYRRIYRSGARIHFQSPIPRPRPMQEELHDVAHIENSWRRLGKVRKAPTTAWQQKDLTSCFQVDPSWKTSQRMWRYVMRNATPKRETQHLPSFLSIWIVFVVDWRFKEAVHQTWEPRFLTADAASGSPQVSAAQEPVANIRARKLNQTAGLKGVRNEKISSKESRDLSLAKRHWRENSVLFSFTHYSAHTSISTHRKKWRKHAENKAVALDAYNKNGT